MTETGPDAARLILTRAVDDAVFPAAAAEVGCASGPIWRTSAGRLTFDADARPATEDTIFDLASLTKPLATTLLALDLVDRGRLRFDEPLADILPAWHGDDRAAVTITDLLEHASGLPARLLDRPTGARTEFEHDICAIPLEYPPRTQSLYSDLDFILLGFIVADRAGEPMHEAFRTMWPGEPGGFIAFGPVAAQADLPVAPTMPLDDDLRRGRRLVGEVHDLYAHLLGGVAGHAGLFGNVQGVGGLARATLRSLRGDAGPAPPVPRELIVRAARRSKVPGSSRALGWDTMLPTSSCGTRLSAEAIGHVGFTGTSLWIDPPIDRYFVLLANRACGGGTLAAMRTVRRAFHDALAGA